MIDNQKVLAIVPARGGSKGVPRKNIKNLGGKPLIAWTIEAALNSTFIDRVIVSTDDEEIAVIASEAGGDVPFLRPANIATDEANSVAVVEHVLNNVEEEFSVIVFLQPTSPFRTTTHIDEALGLMLKHQSDSVISVVKMEKSPEWMYWLTNDQQKLAPILDESGSTRRQDARTAYSLNGAIYCIRRPLFQQMRSFLFEETVPYIMSGQSSLDIDTPEDFEFAEYQIAKGFG